MPILGQKGTFSRQALFGHFPRASTTVGTVGGSWVRQGRYKLIRLWFDGSEKRHAYELYDLENDIGEKQNLVTSMPEKVNEMSARLDTWLTKTGARLPIPNPKYNPNAQKPRKRKGL